MAMREAEDFTTNGLPAPQAVGTVLSELFRFKADDASRNTLKFKQCRFMAESECVLAIENIS